MPSKPIRITSHAAEQCTERGASVSEVELAIRVGVREAVREGRWMYRYNLPFNGLWQGKHYSIKQVAPIVAEDGGVLVVVTVLTFYF